MYKTQQESLVATKPKINVTIKRIEQEDIPEGVTKCLEKENLTYKDHTIYLAAFFSRTTELLYEKEDVLVGLVSFKYDKERNWINYSLGWTHPYFRNKGIYAELFKVREKVASEICNSQTEIVSLCTQDSLPTFLKNGFREGENTYTDPSILSKIPPMKSKKLLTKVSRYGMLFIK